jgi:hypothetical protein
MIYLRPIPDPVHKRNHTLMITQSTDYKIENKVTGNSVVTQINIVEMNTGVDKDGYMHGKSIGVVPPEYVESIYRHLEFQAACAHYGELINQKLLNFLIRYYPHLKDELLEKDFMKLRDDLSEIIKTDDRFYGIERLNTSNSRKTFRKLFAEFIEDRNIYTHGSLNYRTNDNKILLKYIDKHNKKFTYAEINLEIMESYEELFSYLNKIIADLGKQLGIIEESEFKSHKSV